jgi:hypothetical protein
LIQPEKAVFVAFTVDERGCNGDEYEKQAQKKCGSFSSVDRWLLHEM